MSAIRIRKHIDSDTLHLPEVRPLIGRTVEIVIVEAASAASQPSAAEKFLALAPQEKPLDAAEIEALRSDPRYKRFWPLLEVAGEDIIDADAIAQLRAASIQ
jgi:hypothetical protein